MGGHDEYFNEVTGSFNYLYEITNKLKPIVIVDNWSIDVPMMAITKKTRQYEDIISMGAGFLDDNRQPCS